MPGRVYAELLEVATGQYGYVTTDDARALGVDPAQLRLMHHRGTLDRLGHGLYRFPVVPVTPLDQYMEAVLWLRTPAAISHETALDLFELCDVNPAKIHLTVAPQYHLRRQIPAAYELHPRALDEPDVTRYEGIPIVTVRRAILDGIEVRLGGHLIDQAIDNAKRSGALAPGDLEVVVAAWRGDAAPQSGRRSEAG